MCKGKDYTFILINNNLFINIEQNIFELSFILYSKMKPFKIFDRPIGSLHFLLLPKSIIRVIRVLQFINKFYKVKKEYKLKGSHSVIITKHYGNCLLMLRQGGMKVFNLRREVVTTVFPNTFPMEEFEKRVSTIKESQKCELTPRIIDWNMNGKFIVEFFVNASSPSYNQAILSGYYNDVLPILRKIISTTKPKIISFEILSKDKIEELISNINRITDDQNPISNDKRVITDFLKYIRGSFKRIPYQERVSLVFSHGDLWEGNILVNGNKHYVIDWDTQGYRSFYFDFYYSMFMLASKNKHFNTVDVNGIKKLDLELDNSCHLFYEELKGNLQSVHGMPVTIPDQYTLYRYLFYLELIQLKLEGKSNMVEKIEEVITWIKRFKVLEEQRCFSELKTNSLKKRAL